MRCAKSRAKLSGAGELRKAVGLGLAARSAALRSSPAKRTRTWKVDSQVLQSNHSQKAWDGIICFLGVTGFDGLYFERRATQCTLAYHLNLARKHTCKEHSCKRKVAILRYERFCVRFRDCLTALRQATSLFSSSFSRV